MPTYEEAKRWCGWATGCARSKYFGFPPDAVVRSGAGWEGNKNRKANDLQFEYGVQHTSTMRGFKGRAERHYYSIVRRPRPFGDREVRCAEEIAAALFGLAEQQDAFVAWLAARRLGSSERFDLRSLLRPGELHRRVYIAEFDAVLGRLETVHTIVALKSFGGDDKVHEHFGSILCPDDVVHLLHEIMREAGVECWTTNAAVRRNGAFAR